MSLWQSPEWNSMLKNSDQSDAIFELESIFVQKRRIGL
jgi:hypothetical protein